MCHTLHCRYLPNYVNGIPQEFLKIIQKFVAHGAAQNVDDNLLNYPNKENKSLVVVILKAFCKSERLYGIPVSRYTLHNLYRRLGRPRSRSRVECSIVPFKGLNHSRRPCVRAQLEQEGIRVTCNANRVKLTVSFRIKNLYPILYSSFFQSVQYQRSIENSMNKLLPIIVLPNAFIFIA